MTKNRYEAIVGFRIGSTITTDTEYIQANLMQDIQLIKKGVAELMSSFDFGTNWDDLANSRTLFYLKNDEPITIQQYILEKKIEKLKGF